MKTDYLKVNSRKILNLHLETNDFPIFQKSTNNIPLCMFFYFLLVLWCNCITEQICLVTNHISIQLFGACVFSDLQKNGINWALMLSDTEHLINM